MQEPKRELNIAQAHFGSEVRRRAPWILLAVAAGIVMIFIGQAYEEAFSAKVELVLFIPVIVYMSGAIGTETVALFVRELALGRLKLSRILLKEILVGLSLGAIAGAALGLFAYLWFRDIELAVVVGSTLVINGLMAVVIGMMMPVIFSLLRRDPAVGTDELTTALTDNLSLLVYFAVAATMLFRL